MPDPIAILALIFGFVVAVMWLVFGFVRWRIQQKHEERREAGSSLRTSELREMMREASEAANAPLLARIEMLEEKLQQAAAPRLPAAHEESFLEEPAPEAEAARRRVT